MDETETPAVDAARQFADAAYREPLGKPDEGESWRFGIPMGSESATEANAREERALFMVRGAACIRLYIKVSVAVAFWLCHSCGAPQIQD